MAEGFFSGTATAIHQSFFIPLLVQLGVGSLALGIYTSLNGLLANASGLLGGALSRRVPNRRTLAVLTGGLGRLGFLVIALLLLSQGRGTSTPLLIAIALVSAAFVGLGLPVLTALVADAVAERERGSFFAARLLASGIGSAIVSIGIAALLRQLAFPSGFAIAYLLAALAGLGSAGSLLALRRMQATPRHTAAAQGGWSGDLTPRLLRYAAATFVLWLGASLIAPVLTPYILTDLGAPASFIGLMTAVNALVGISVQRYWGRRVDRGGAFPVLAVCTLSVASLPLLYAVTPTYWLALLFEVISGVAWSGYALASVNFSLELAPPERRVQVTSVANAAAGLGAFLGPLLAAGLLQVVEPQVVLLCSASVRLAAFAALRQARPARTVVPASTPS